MSKSIRHIIAGIGFFVGTCVAGVMGYRIAGWSLVDSIYMVVITIFGVGYGEVRPVDTPDLRIFTSALIVAGYGAAVYAVGGFIQFVTEGEINRALGARRMTKEIDRLSGHTIVCGYGRVGRILAERLAEDSAGVVVIDADASKVAAAEADGHRVVQGDAAEERILRTAGIERAKKLAAVLSSDSANVFVTLTATGMREDLLVIARAEDPSSESKLRRSGAHDVILPAAIGADRIANLLIHPSAEELLRGAEGLRFDLGDQFGQLGLRIEELTVPADSRSVRVLGSWPRRPRGRPSPRRRRPREASPARLARRCATRRIGRFRSTRSIRDSRESGRGARAGIRFPGSRPS
mgnify:CR=1 FL=1